MPGTSSDGLKLLVERLLEALEPNREGIKTSLRYSPPAQCVDNLATSFWADHASLPIELELPEQQRAIEAHGIRRLVDTNDLIAFDVE